jgi:hypothetical protein
VHEEPSNNKGLVQLMQFVVDPEQVKQLLEQPSQVSFAEFARYPVGH